MLFWDKHVLRCNSRVDEGFTTVEILQAGRPNPLHGTLVTKKLQQKKNKNNHDQNDNNKNIKNKSLNREEGRS